jgi:hypothetical protein
MSIQHKGYAILCLIYIYSRNLGMLFPYPTKKNCQMLHYSAKHQTVLTAINTKYNISNKTLQKK